MKFITYKKKLSSIKNKRFWIQILSPPCKVVGCASSVGLLPAALGPSFLDKGVGTDPNATQVGPACV